MDVGNSEPDRARVEIAHDETRQEPPPGLRQDAQNVLAVVVRSPDGLAEHTSDPQCVCRPVDPRTSVPSNS